VNISTGGSSRVTVRADGDLDLGGNVRKGGLLFMHNLALRNTAIGLNALASNSGSYNTAIGHEALSSNTTGNRNTAVGHYALAQNAAAYDNTAVGESALYTNATGTFNTAVGSAALLRNAAGQNTALGASALLQNTVGSSNTALGAFALNSNVGGGGNIAIGSGAGSSLDPNANNNIVIGNPGQQADISRIRIGTSLQISFFAAGIRGVTTGVADAIPVLIDSNGQLGTVSSSRRFKEEVQDMGDVSSNLMKLRPVTFRYQKPYADGTRPIDYGLIAEEVAEVYPDLVVRGKDGKVETVQYQKLTPMLLNELQREHRRGEEQAEMIREQSERIRALEDRFSALERQR
jgi:hypothetical protein